MDVVESVSNDEMALHVEKKVRFRKKFWFLLLVSVGLELIILTGSMLYLDFRTKKVAVNYPGQNALTNKQGLIVLNTPDGSSTYTIPRDSYEGGGTFDAWGGSGFPCERPEGKLGIGGGSELRLIPSQENFVIVRPFEIRLRYTDEPHASESSFKMYYCNSDTSLSNTPYRELETQVLDTDKNFISAKFDKPGGFIIFADRKCVDDVAEYDDHYDSSWPVGRVAPRVIGLGDKKLIPFGKNSFRIFDNLQDVDWFQFGVKRGGTYLIEAIGENENVKPIVKLYDQGGVALLSEGLGEVSWKVPTSYIPDPEETFMNAFVMVLPDKESLTGCAARYNFKITER